MSLKKCLVFIAIFLFSIAQAVETKAVDPELEEDLTSEPATTVTPTEKIETKQKKKSNDKANKKRSSKVEERAFAFGLETYTIFPLFLGVGADFAIQERFQIGLAYGLAPQMYYGMIGQVAANLGGNGAYKDVIIAAFQNNSIVRTDLRYNFSKSTSGWRIGAAFDYLKSSGKAGIDTVLYAATGRNFTQLKNLLALAGQSSDVSIEASLWIAELYLGYAWELIKDLTLSSNLGVAKVVSADVKLKTGLTNFESTNAGNSLMRSTEDDLKNIIYQYGLSPTLSLGLAYTF